MTAPQPASNPPRARRWPRRVAGVACVLVPAALILATGWPQTRLAESIAGRALGATVDVQGLSLIPAVRIRALSVAAESYAPLLLAENIRLDYAVSLTRPLTALSIYRVSLHLDGSNPAQTNYAFLLGESQQPEPKGNAGAKYLPRTVAIDHIDVEVNAPEASTKLEGLQLRAQSKGFSLPTVSLQGDHVTGYVQSGSDAPHPFSGGIVDIGLQSGQPINLQARVSIPDAVELTGDATVKGLLATGIVTVNLETCRINGARVAGLLALLSPAPVSFDQADLSGINASLAFENSRLALLESSVHASATNIMLGEAGKEWYEGDFALTGVYTNGQLDAEARLNRGQRLKVMAKGNIDQGKAAATLIGWSRDDFKAALPVTMRPLLEQVPGLRQVEGTLEASWELPRYSVELSIDPVFAPSAGEKNQLAITASGSGFVDSAAGPLWDGTAALRLGKGQCDVTARVESAARVRGKVKLASANPNRILAALGKPALPGITTDALRGTLAFDMNGDTATLSVDVSAAPMRLGSVEIPADKPLEVKGTLVANTKTAKLTSTEVNVRLTDNGNVTLRDVSITPRPLAVKASVSGKLDFDYLAPDLGIAGLSGAVEFDAPIRYAGETVSGVVTLKGDGLGYGSFASPYGTPITLTGHARYDTKRSSGTMEKLQILWGENTAIASESFTLTSLSPVGAGGAIAVASDLRPLVDLSFLDSSDGSGNASGTVGYGAEGPRAAMDWDVSARSLVLAKALAALGGVSAKGAMRYDGGLYGDGKFIVANAAAGGGLLTDVDGAFVLENGVVKADGVSAKLYEGNATVTAQMDLFGQEGRSTLKASVAGMNLDTFTKEYKPPVVLLTGLAQGDVELEWAKAGITDFRVELTSDKDFSLNRESVEQLLLTALTSEVPGLKFLNRRIRKKTIGDDPMRPFDTASVSLRLEGQPGETQRLMGPVALTSDTLDFTIDMGVDLGAIAEGLQLSQEAQLEDIEKISTDPLQWNE